MKKALLILPVCLILMVAHAQKMDAKKVPAAVKAGFAKQYPAMAATQWELENGEYEASFKMEGTSHSANFKPDGTFVESEVDIPPTDLPATVANYMKQHYKNEVLKEAARITKADGTTFYEAGIKGKDVVFDSNGKFVKVTKD